MAVKFSPNGFLDLSTDPSELPGTKSGELNIGDSSKLSYSSKKDEISGAMRRCTNLTLDQNGRASTRNGSSLVTSDAMTHTVPHKIIEQGGHRYCFNDTAIYKMSRPSKPVW